MTNDPTIMPQPSIVDKLAHHSAGLFFLRNNAFHKWLRKTYSRLLTVCFPGGRLWTINNLDSFLFDSSLRMISHRHEPDIWLRLMNAIKPGDRIADVGACVGVYSLSFAKRVGNSGQVVAFEPDPENFRLLLRHIKLNDFEQRVLTVSKALSSQANECLLFSACQGPNSRVTQDTQSSISVQSTTLDSWFGTDGIDILKIDVEGFEQEVLTGAYNVLRHKNKPRLIYIELHPFLWPKEGIPNKCVKLYVCLTEPGYHLFAPCGAVVKEPSELAKLAGVFAIPAENS